jgi:acyl-coenzyme A thioesterase PaaI-like protein/acyl carrier protein
MERITLPWLEEPKFRCFGCSPRNHIGLALRMHRVGPGVIRSEVTFGENYASYPGVVHGGIVGVLVDEIMGGLLALDHGMLAFSTTLRTRFLMPLRVGEPYVAEARIAKEGVGVIMTEADVSGKDGEACHGHRDLPAHPFRPGQGVHGPGRRRLRPAPPLLRPPDWRVMTSTLDRADILTTIRGLVSGELSLPAGEIGDDVPLKELAGADSVKMLRVVAQIERRYDAEFEDEDVFKVRTLNELVDLTIAYGGRR